MIKFYCSFSLDYRWIDFEYILLNNLQPLIWIIQVSGCNNWLSFPLLADVTKFDFQRLRFISLSVSWVLDYRNVRCVSQSNYYHTIKCIQAKKSKTCIPMLCNAPDQVFYQSLDKNSSIYILTYKMCVLHLFHGSLSTATHTAYMNYECKSTKKARSMKILICIHQGNTCTPMHNY